MFKYSRYLLSYVSRKQAVYTIPLFLCVVFNLSTYFGIARANDQGFAFINTFSTFNYFIPFTIMGTFCAMIVIYVFKETEMDGSDLLILSKPISRVKMILSKFIVTYVVILIYTIVTGVNFTLISLFDSVAWENDSLAALKFGASLSLGTFIISFIITSLTIILSTRFSKTSILNFNGAFIPVIPVLSFIVSTATGGLPTQAQFIRQPSYRLSAKDMNLESVTSRDPENISKLLNEIQIETYYFVNDGEMKADFEEYKENNIYETIAYVDPWYHWSRFMALFVEEDRIITTNPKNFNLKEIQVSKKNDQETIKIGNKEYIFFANSTEIMQLASLFEELQNEKKAPLFAEDFMWIKSYLDSKSPEEFSFMEVASSLERIFNNLSSKEEEMKSVTEDKDLPAYIGDSDKFWKGRLASGATSSSMGILLYQFLSTNNLNNTSSTLTKTNFDPKNISSLLSSLQLKRSNKLYLEEYEKDVNYQNKVKSYLAEDGSYIEVAKDEDYVSTSLILIIWSSFVVTMILASFYIYFKRDFK